MRTITLKNGKEIELNQAFNMDCLEFMPLLPDKSIDLILCDLPFGTTACKWDVIIPFDKLWEQYKRIIKDNGAIVLNGAEPFSSMLRLSNLKWYKYDWKWKKSQATGFLNSWKQPLRDYEDVCVFSNKQPKYYPKITDKPKENIRPATKRTKLSDCYGESDLNIHKLPADKSMPKSILEFNNEQRNIHPTQKPVKLSEYFIETYTDELDLVLDNCAGSFTTPIAAYNTRRNWLACEMDKQIFTDGYHRYEQETKQMLMEF